MVHIVQNDPLVPPGTIAEALSSIGRDFFVHHPYLADPLPDLKDVTALIVLGGAMGANDDARHPFLRDLKKFIRECVEQNIPYLGVCLGGQLLAAAVGAQVVSNRWGELGTLEVTLTHAGMHDPLFTGIDGTFSTFQWHHDSFDLPAGGTLLASSSACPHQAFRLGKRAWGVQFHPEVTEGIIREWCDEDPATGARCHEMVNAWQAIETGYRSVLWTLLANFLLQAGLLTVSRGT